MQAEAVPPITALPPEEDEAAALLATAARRLARRDRKLGAVVKRAGPCALRRQPGGFPRLFQAILRQQLAAKAAETITGRLLTALGGTAAAEVVATLDDGAFAAAGVSRQKREYLRGLAAASLAEPALFDRLEHLPDDAVIAALTAIKGIGRWTADMYLIFVLGRLDVLPLGDLSIRVAMTDLHGLKRETKPKQLMALAEAWRPYRSVACWYLYRYLDGRPARPKDSPAKRHKGRGKTSGKRTVKAKVKRKNS
jgi:DNA-3-methyladenine glycosylase II